MSSISTEKQVLENRQVYALYTQPHQVDVHMHNVHLGGRKGGRGGGEMERERDGGREGERSQRLNSDTLFV